MKTSNKLLIGVSILAVASIVLFDTALRAEYLKGDYKLPHYNQTLLPLKDFNTIENYTSDQTFLEVSQGNKFEVWVSNGSEKDLTIKVRNYILSINYTKVNSNVQHNYFIHVTLPKLACLSTHVTKGAKIIYMTGNTVVGILRQDSLRIISDAPTSINVTPVFLKKINIAMNQGEINLGGTSNIDTANFNLHNDSKLNIGDVRIGKLSYQFDSMSKISLSGASLHQLSR